MAAALAAQGFSKGDTLALLVHNCRQFPVIVFAAARLGVILVPINFMLSAGEIAYLLEHSRSRSLVAEDSLVMVAEDALAQVPDSVDTKAVIRLADHQVPSGWMDVAAWVQHELAPLSAVTIDEDDPLRLMYTSGTESRPKGAMLSSRSLLWQYISCMTPGGMESSDIELHALPLYHCAQLDNFLATDIYLGATSVIVREPDPALLLRTIAAEGITNLFGPPTLWISLLHSPTFDSTNLATLRKGYGPAAAPAPAHRLALAQRLDNALRHRCPAQRPGHLTPIPHAYDRRPSVEKPGRPATTTRPRTTAALPAEINQ